MYVVMDKNVVTFGSVSRRWKFIVVFLVNIWLSLSLYFYLYLSVGPTSALLSSKVQQP